MLLIPSCIVLTACDNKKAYNLANLSKDFYSIAETEEDNIVHIDNAIEFDFSNDNKFLQETINNAPYTALKDYNLLFQNLMTFSFNHIDICAASKMELSPAVANNLKTELDNLHNSIKEVNLGINLLAEGILLSQNIYNPICLERYKNLLLMYEDLFQKASCFNNSVSTIYFKNLNYNYYET